MLLAALLVLLAGLLVATHRPGPGVASGGELTQQRTWTLTRLVVSGREQPLVPGHAPTINFGRRHGQVDGEMGCNSYMGTYTLAGETLHFSGVFFTLALCHQPALNEQEDAYSEALPRVERYHLEGNTLLLISAGGCVQLTFRAI